MKELAREIKIAIADDHTLFRKGIISIINDPPDRVVVADSENGQCLIEAIGKLAIPPDVCLLDVSMPVMDGFQTLPVLKAKYPLMKFLALTMYDHEFTIIKMLRNGAHGYLLKESDPRDLIEAIMTVAGDNYIQSPTVTNRLVSMVKGGKDPSKALVSENEQIFLELCCTDLIYKEIAAKMNLSVRTVEGYRDDLFQRLGTKTRTGLVLYALRHGIITLG